MRRVVSGRRAALADFGRFALLGLSAFGIGGSALMLGGCESLLDRIRNRPMRRDLATLPANDPIIETYRAAVAAMKALPASDPRNWNAQAEIHFNFCPHGNWFFLPWHRAYLLYFEQICRALTGNATFALPYWNWTCNRSLPAPFLGDASNALFHPGRAGVPPAALPSSAVGTAVIDAILDEPNFLIFASSQSAALRPPVGYGPLEGNPHNHVHGFVGGEMGAFRSPRDPIFWMHHNMIERIWWEWNVVRGQANTNDAAWNGFSLNGMFVTATGAPATTTVGIMNLAPILSYRFDNSPITACGPGRVVFDLDSDALRRFLEEGGPVALRTIKSIARSGPVQVPVGRAVHALRARDSVLSADATLSPAARILLQVHDVEEPPTGDFFVRVFVNLPSAGAATPIDDPHYAGSFAFFSDHGASGHVHGHAAYLVDLTPAVRRLRGLGGISATGDLSIQLVAVRQTPGPLRQAFLRAGSLELQLAESAAPAAKPFGSASPR